MDRFQKVLGENGVDLYRDIVKTVQINMGNKCNQTCEHCHIYAGPNRTENMTEGIVDQILFLLQNSPEIECVDITGGAPELNDYFRKLVLGAKTLGLHVIDWCNLTVLSEKGQEETAQFLAENQVEIFASLPCYTKENVDSQRGSNVYDRSIFALKTLNELGYGKAETGNVLNLVYNPKGDYLPGNHHKLEEDYKKVLWETQGITFNHLVTITNMAIGRFENLLEKQGRLSSYQTLLEQSFNAQAAKKIMCKQLISIGYNGTLYDCDFNQVLRKRISDKQNTIFQITGFHEITEKIEYGTHCFACTAGCGSSCHGKLA